MGMCVNLYLYAFFCTHVFLYTCLSEQFRCFIQQLKRQAIHFWVSIILINILLGFVVSNYNCYWHSGSCCSVVLRSAYAFPLRQASALLYCVIFPPPTLDDCEYLHCTGKTPETGYKYGEIISFII